MDRKHFHVEIEEITVNYKEINQIISTVMREHEGEVEIDLPAYVEGPSF